MDELRKQFKKLLFNTVQNGGAGSGNWGHAGRKGKIGGSKKEPTGSVTPHQKERRDYGRRLRELSETFGAENIGKKYKEKTKQKTEQIKKEGDFLGNRPTKKQIKDFKKTTNPNYKPEFKTLATSATGAKLVEKDGKVAWLKPSFIREDGSLTPGGQKALNEGKTVEEYKKEQALIEKRIKEKEQSAQNIKKDFNIDLNDGKHIYTGDVVRKILTQNPNMYEKIKDFDDESLIAKYSYLDNVRKTAGGILSYDANYWESKDGTKQRIYFNIHNGNLENQKFFIDLNDEQDKYFR